MAEFKIIDVHTHAFPDFLAERAMSKLTESSGEYKPHTDGTIDGLLKSMDESGVASSFVANIATRPEQARSIVEWSRMISSDRIISLGSVNPLSEGSLDELNDIKHAGIPGIKLHPQYQGFVLDDRAVYPLYERSSELGLFILFHTGYDIAFPGNEYASPDKLGRVLRDFPTLNVISAHMGGWRDWDRSIEFLAGRDVYLETSFVGGIDAGRLSVLMNKHDKNRVLFGSDLPWMRQDEQVKYVMGMDISTDDKEKIFYKNAQDLLSESGYGAWK